MRQAFIQTGKYIPQNNGVSGIKVYKGDVYATMPRYFDGVPASLNKIVTKDGEAVMQPFPDWDNYTIEDCNGLQFMQSMEIDPNTGLMWAIDGGRTALFEPNATRNSCPAKVVGYNLETKKEIINPAIVVVDVKGKRSYRLEDPESMAPRESLPVDIDGTPFDPKLGINGIAMSSDFRYVYFSSINVLKLHQVPTGVLRNQASNDQKIARPDTMAIDQDGYLWVTASNAGRIFLGQPRFFKDHSHLHRGKALPCKEGGRKCS
ncbi:major royal jelly protein 1-like [Liolophura sinensis]|uniref:major royal jelly protein 1-like n=1 Tax=Liolophura sinensis TaxID=3198878 RepID=UPI00315938BA